MRGYSAIGLHLAKNPHNVGSALRAAYAYGATMLAVSGKRDARCHCPFMMMNGRSGVSGGNSLCGSGCILTLSIEKVERLPFLELQLKQAITTFSGTVLPPLVLGMT